MNTLKLTPIIPGFFLVLLVISQSITAFAQSKEPKKNLEIGQKAPDFIFKSIVNYKSSRAKRSDFKGKLLILDFWATWCNPCVRMFSKTDSLEQQFNGRIKFLPITRESKEIVSEFLNKMKNIKGTSPASVVNDTELSDLFHSPTLPHYVWLDETGKLIARTGKEEITSEKINAALSGNTRSIKNSVLTPIKELEYLNSIFVLNPRTIQKDTTEKRQEIMKNDIISYSVSTKYMEQGPGKFVVDSNHLAAVNISIGLLYRYCYDLGYYEKPIKGAFASVNSRIFEFKNPEKLNKLIPPRDSIKKSKDKFDMFEWSRNNAVCYEIIFPKGLSWKQKMELVKQDLDRYFASPYGFKTHVEKRIDSNVYVLKRIKNVNITSKGGIKEKHYDRYSYRQQNTPINEFTSLLRSYFFQTRKISFIDQTDYNMPVDLDINCDMQDIDSINNAIAKYGFTFQRETNKIDVLVFSDDKPVRHSSM